MQPRHLAGALVIASLVAATPGVSAAPPNGAPEQRVAPQAGSRVEPAVAVDPRNPKRVAVVTIDLGRPYPDAAMTGYELRDVVFVSDDGGRTYQQGPSLPSVDPEQPSSNDPTLWWSPDGSLYAGYGSFGPPNTTAGPNTRDGAWVARSTDGGRTWPQATTVQRFADRACGGPDKPMVTGDPRRPHRVFLVYVYLQGEAICGGAPAPAGGYTTEIRYAASVDRGRTWSVPRPIGRGFGPSAKVADDGSLVIAYAGVAGEDGGTGSDCVLGYISTLVATVDPRGRVATTVAVPSACGAVAGYGFNGSAMSVHNLPTLEIDRRTGTVVAAVATNGPDAGVVVSRSRDHARSWTRTTLSEPPGTVMAMPQLAAGPTGGLGLLYLQSAPGGVYTATMRGSVDGGQTWSASTAVASVPSPGNLRPRHAFDPYNLGHYLGLALGRDGVAHAAWPDLRPGSGTPNEPDIWVRGMPIAP